MTPATIRQTRIHIHTHTQTVHSRRYQSVGREEKQLLRDLASLPLAAQHHYLAFTVTFRSAQSVHCYCGERSLFLTLFSSVGCAEVKINKGFVGAIRLGKKTLVSDGRARQLNDYITSR